MEDVLVPISFFLLVFGIVYVFLTIRNKERLALIEKGVDASVFTNEKRNAVIIARIIVLNLALLVMGIGLGIFVAIFLGRNTNLNIPLVYPASTCTMAGLALLIGFFLTKKIDKKV